MPTCAFYVVADARFFPGAVALVNSLRLVGHEDPIVVLDGGLEEGQRELLRREATILTGIETDHPVFLRWSAPREHPLGDAMLLVDADVIAVRSLAPVIELAAAGKVVAFVDLAPSRFDPGWAELLGVEPFPRRTYVNAGFIALPTERGRELLGRLEAAQEKVPLDLVRPDGTRPFLFREQDVFNAVLAASVPPDDVVVLERRLAPAPPFYALSVVDERTLECRFRDGLQPYLLHHIDDKPWLSLAHPSPYSQLLPRLLFAPDLPIRLTPEQVSLRLRPGPRGAALRAALALRWFTIRARFKARVVLSRTGSERGS